MSDNAVSQVFVVSSPPPTSLGKINDLCFNDTLACWQVKQVTGWSRPRLMLNVDGPYPVAPAIVAPTRNGYSMVS